MDEHARDEPPLAEWVTLSEMLMRGLVHALNNRVTALGAFLELAAMGDAEFTPERVLPGEIQSLQRVNALFRALLEEVSAAEAMEITPVIDDALALHAHHPRLRTLRCEIEHVGAPVPLRVPRWAFVRLVLLYMEAAKLAADRAGRTVAVLTLTSTDETVVLRTPSTDAPMPYAGMMAEACGGTLRNEGDSLVLSLPTLLEVRRRERAARSGLPPA